MRLVGRQTWGTSGTSMGIKIPCGSENWVGISMESVSTGSQSICDGAPLTSMMTGTPAISASLMNLSKSANWGIPDLPIDESGRPIEGEAVVVINGGSESSPALSRDKAGMRMLRANHAPSKAIEIAVPRFNDLRVHCRVRPIMAQLMGIRFFAFSLRLLTTALFNSYCCWPQQSVNRFVDRHWNVRLAG